MITSFRIGLALLCAFAVAGMTPAAAQTPSPAGAKIYFINLKDGAEVTSPFLVQFGLSGMGVAPAGVEKPNTGHHHLIIDTKLTDEQRWQLVLLVRSFAKGAQAAPIPVPNAMAPADPKKSTAPASH